MALQPSPLPELPKPVLEVSVDTDTLSGPAVLLTVLQFADAVLGEDSDYWFDSREFTPRRITYRFWSYDVRWHGVPAEPLRRAF